MSSRAVHVILPGIVDDPRRPSGGSVYDDRVCRGLAGRGFQVRRSVVGGTWPGPGPRERAEVAQVLADVPPHALVLLDGLVGSACPEALTAQASRLRLVVLLHRPAADEPGSDDACEAAARERSALRAARAVVVPSEGIRRRLLADPGLAGLTVHVAPPGTEHAPATAPTAAGTRLAYVMVVTEALARGVPVVGTAVDGLPEALGRAPSGDLPGELVPPADPAALAAALRRWLTEPRLRDRLRAAALARRKTLPSWDATTSAVAAALGQAGEAA